MRDKWIWLDMDGTITDLYGVNNWLEDLQNENTRPYAIAKTIYNTFDLLIVLSELKKLNYKIGVISWCAKNSSKEYDCKVIETKKAWLAENGFNDIIDKIIITPYGVTKANTCKPFGMGILVDDEKQNRDAWNLGSTIDANMNILKILRELTKVA